MTNKTPKPDYPPCSAPIRETEPDSGLAYSRDCNHCPNCLTANAKLLTGGLGDALGATTPAPEPYPSYNWTSTGPGGCDTHCIEHPCGPCLTETKIDHAQPPDDEAHECDNDLDLTVDFDLCPRCGEHTGFCSVCELSTCCGEAEIHRDHDDYDMER